MAIRTDTSVEQGGSKEFGHSRHERVRIPSFRQMVSILVKRLCNPGHFRMPTSHRRDSLILDVALALRMGQIERADELLSTYDRVLTGDPAYLSLLGVIFEARGMTKIAHRCYGTAICLDPNYAPAQQNMRRIYELSTFGHTNLQVALGDAELRMRRNVPPARDLAELPPS